MIKVFVEQPLASPGSANKLKFYIYTFREGKYCEMDDTYTAQLIEKENIFDLKSSVQATPFLLCGNFLTVVGTKGYPEDPQLLFKFNLLVLLL